MTNVSPALASTAASAASADVAPTVATGRLGRRTWALFTAAGLALIAGELTWTSLGLTTADQYAHALAHRPLLVVSGLCYTALATLELLAVWSARRQSTTGRGSRLIGLGLALMIGSALWYVISELSSDWMMWAATAPGVEKDSAVLLLDARPAGFGTVDDLCLVLVLAAPIVLSVGLLRARAVNVVPLILWVAGFVGLGVFEFTSKPFGTLAAVVMAAALCLIGRAFTRVPSIR